MIQLPELPQHAEPRLDGSELVLCATSRLAAELRRRYDARQAALGRHLWQPLDTCTPSQWLSRLAETAVLKCKDIPDELQNPVLGSFQERLLWERIIAQSLSEASAPLFDLGALATTAQDAHFLSVIWNISVGSTWATEECQHFKTWQEKFAAECASRRVMDTARYQRTVVRALETLDLTLPKQVVLAGFDRLSPLESRLCATLGQRGVALRNLYMETGASAPPRLVSYPDQRAECHAAAVWARAELGTSPNARIGIVVPNLAGMRDRLQDTLEDLLHPSCVRPAQTETAREFNFSLGKPLSALPIISTALDLLRLALRPDRFEQSFIGTLLTGPYWSANMGEMDDRSRLEAAMRTGLGWSTSLHKVLSFVRWQTDKAGLTLPRLMLHLDALITESTKLKKTHLPSVWANHFRAALTRTGWPGERTLSSHDYQARQAWFEELAALASLDPLLGTISAQEALARLTQLCRLHIFQPKTEGQPRIQVLGMLEASGMSFSHLWVMGMNDGAWPAPARPNPLLPAESQRVERVPNASAEVEVAFAHAIQARLLASASDVTVSWPRQDGDTILRPSPLLAPFLPGEDLAAPISSSWAAQSVTAAVVSRTESFEDALAPPVQEGEHVSGGTSLLRAQAICPAWGYFQYRLGAKKLETPVDGLDPTTRGSLVHTILEQLWTQLDTSQALHDLDESGQSGLVETCIDQVLDGYGQDRKHEPLNPRFKALERARLIKLLSAWLALERTRTEPFSVVACELESNVSIEGISARMIIDRIDRLADGRLLIIDYKTGKTIDFKNWASNRITEPQLPIYAALAQSDAGTVAGVAFAKVLLDGPEFVGISETEDLLPGVPALDSKKGNTLFPNQSFPDWPAVIEHWRRSIEAMAREVKAGDAAVRFASEKDLRYCDVLPILRLAERRAQWAEHLAGSAP